MSEQEKALADYLAEARKETKYIYLSLWPPSGAPIGRHAVNECRVEISTRSIAKFPGISERFYDSMVDAYDARS